MKNLSFYYFNKTKQTQSSLKKYFSFQNFFYSQNKNIFFTIVKLKEKSKNFKSEKILCQKDFTSEHRRKYLRVYSGSSFNEDSVFCSMVSRYWNAICLAFCFDFETHKQRRKSKRHFLQYYSQTESQNFFLALQISRLFLKSQKL